MSNNPIQLVLIEFSQVLSSIDLPMLQNAFIRDLCLRKDNTFRLLSKSTMCDDAAWLFELLEILVLQKKVCVVISIDRMSKKDRNKFTKHWHFDKARWNLLFGKRLVNEWLFSLALERSENFFEAHKRIKNLFESKRFFVEERSLQENMSTPIGEALIKMAEQQSLPKLYNTQLLCIIKHKSNNKVAQQYRGLNLACPDQHGLTKEFWQTIEKEFDFN